MKFGIWRVTENQIECLKNPRFDLPVEEIWSVEGGMWSWVIHFTNRSLDTLTINDSLDFLAAFYFAIGQFQNNKPANIDNDRIGEISTKSSEIVRQNILLSISGND